MNILETDRLILRTFEMEDLDDFAALEADPVVMRFYASGARSRAAAERGIAWFAELQAKHGYSLWAVVRKPDEAFIGCCGLLPQTIDDTPEVEIAYKLALAHWGQGYATEAARAIRDWSFANLAVDRLISIIDAENVASIRVADKNGMRHWKNAAFHGKTCRIYAIARNEADLSEQI
jgi:ribosomal-protein-alanine N-acetyltransferase